MPATPQKFTNLKEDSSLGIVLSAFYAIGICLLTRIQKMEFGNQSGLDSFSLAKLHLWPLKMFGRLDVP